MRINTNIASLQAQSRLLQTTNAMSRSLQRLSSGQRINRAGDDASGLAIASGLDSQIRSLRRGVLNMNDAYGILSTAEGALRAQLEIIQRVREIAVQSSNGTIGNEQRAYLNTEVQQLMEEFTRISQKTEFNGLKLLDGSFENMELQIGANRGQQISLALEAPEKINLTLTTGGAAEGLGTFEGSTMDPAFSSYSEFVDVDGDGDQDVIGVNNNGEVVVGVNDGSGNFSSTTAYDPDLSAFHVRAGDVNGDGNLDLVSIDPNEDYASVLEGDGTGNFAAATTFAIAAGSNSGELRIFDFDGDGRDEVAIGGVSRYIRLYENNGSGVYSQVRTLDAGVSGLGSTFDIVDYNGDGHMDIVSAFQATAATDRIFVFANNGSGNFFGRATMASGSEYSGIGVGDFNGNDTDDIVYYNTSTGNISIRFDNGTTTTLSYAGASVGAFGTGDYDNDGDIDIVLSHSIDNRSVILANDGSGSFSEATSFSTAGYFYDFGDFNGDGVLDLTGGDQGIWLQESEGGLEEISRGVSVGTQEDAQNLLDDLDAAIDDISAKISGIGAITSRLEFARNQTGLTIENLASARSLIIDADIASEMADYTKQQVLRQASTSALTQANASLQIALQLLRFNRGQGT